MSNTLRIHTLKNRQGIEARIMEHGGTLLSLLVPDRRGQPADIVLGFDEPERYRLPHPYFGSLIGRYANRIAGGRFVLEDTMYQLSCNDGPHHLHGGDGGFDKVTWESARSGNSVRLSHVSADGTEGYPGNLQVTVTYRLEEDGLEIAYRAVTDRPTVVNLTHHSYFNLAGSGDICEHVLQIGAGSYVPVNEALIPTGDICEVAGTPFDFTSERRVGTFGYDHNLVLDTGGVARLRHPPSGRVLVLETTQPGLQFYSGNQLDGTIVGKCGMRYAKHAGLCLEPQHFPDSPNRPQFPSTVLRPGCVYEHTTRYGFGIE